MFLPGTPIFLREMILRVLRFVAALVVAFFVHLVLVRLLPSFSRGLDVFALVMVWFAMTSNSGAGTLFGAVAGLVHDIASGSPLGLNGFSGSLSGYLVSRTAQQIESTQLSVVAVFFAMGVAIHEAVRALLVYLLVDAANAPELLWVGVRIATSALLGLVLVLVRRRLSGRLESWRHLRRRRVRIGG